MKEKIRRIVLTGGPSSGKTSIIRHLEARGYSVLKESAREILEKFGQPSSLEETYNLEVLMYEVQKQREESCFGLTFLDRSQIDNIAYARHFLGYLPSDISLPKHKYEKIFVLDRLPFVEDGTRTEKSDSEAAHRHEMVIKEYTNQGYVLINVPVLKGSTLEESIEMRANFILSNLEIKVK